MGLGLGLGLGRREMKPWKLDNACGLRAAVGGRRAAGGRQAAGGRAAGRRTRPFVGLAHLIL